MMPLADLFVHVFVLVDDALLAGIVPVPRRPGPAPACSDAEVLTIALVRHLLARPSEAAFLAEVRQNWAHYFPRLPAQSEFNRRVRWLWGAFEYLRRHVVSQLPEDPWQQIDTTALPVKHPSRVRRPDGWHGPGDLHAGFGRDAAHGEGCSGFRLALRTDLGRRLVRAWGIVPAAVDERRVADALLEGLLPQGLLLDRGFASQTWVNAQGARGTQVVLTPGRTERQRLPAAVRRPVAVLRNRIETTTGELTERLGLARHGAKTFWGLLTRWRRPSWPIPVSSSTCYERRTRRTRLRPRPRGGEVAGGGAPARRQVAASASARTARRIPRCRHPGTSVSRLTLTPWSSR
ncbi:MAG TPA: transposase, partial [Limnochorda sp.]